ncbi:MAG: TldD/PmbA family protein [Candidatus Micrarchaeota archaeon]|nr:TldD/PmbA family protein [Candidatus Micrarchaeota archaeon]
MKKGKERIEWNDLKNTADLILSKIKKENAEYAEVRLERSSGESIYLSNGNLEAVSFGSEDGIGVRYLLGGCLGFFSINSFEKENIEKIVDQSIKMTRKSANIGERIEFSEEKAERRKYEIKQKKKIDTVGIEAKLEYVRELDESLLDTDTNIFTRTFYYVDWITEKYYVNSDGSIIESRIPRIDLFYNFIVRENGQNMQRHWQYGVVGGFEKIERMKIDEKISLEAKAMKNTIINGISPPKGEIEVVVSPEISGIMAHESVGHPYEADRILGRESAQAGESFVNPDMIGTRIGSDIVNVADDPTISDSFGYYLYDDEGVRARRKMLIKNGIINEFLHNRQTAAKFKMKSNGSARASQFNLEPIIRMSNTVVLPGDWKEDEIIKETKYGIYIKSFMEWNIDDKRLNQKYKANEAYLIENGKITKPLKQPSIEITTPALWSSVDAVADNFELHAATCGKGEPMQGIPVSMGGASMRMKIRIR